MQELTALLKPGRGEVQLYLPVPDIEPVALIKLPGRFDVSPQQRGELETVPGVIAVVDAVCATNQVDSL